MKESPKGGNPGDPRGKCDENWNDGSVAPIVQDTKHIDALERVSVVSKTFQEIRVPVKSDVPTRDTRTIQIYVYNVSVGCGA
jgi:hypothetical protein